ncbi:hypothetical protein [Microcoleus sp. FACHB-672]|uniref:hypothetical protein n=1 Tax=Microcoleus sp. FACHB-672 TaxID=2692825 RepID=UPI0016899097|nr:hypothetical protein [Microcoleus sp. FACHB-672]MBD2040178.1 hypothetical protein [Microcoleus sp. FACHB-672]
MERERNDLDSECNQLHEKHGDALNQIELLKEQLAEQKSEPAAPALKLLDAGTVFNRLKDKRPKSKAVLKDIEIAMELLDDSLCPGD